MIGVRSLAVLGLVFAIGCGGKSDSDGGAGGSGGTGGSGGAGATGGSGGGTGGTGASGGTGAFGGTGGAIIECSADSECQLFSDCCTCTAYGPNEDPPPTCFADCDQLACDAAGAQGPICQDSKCIAGFDCSSPVLCNAIPPSCVPGETPSIVNGCWGACVRADECRN